MSALNAPKLRRIRLVAVEVEHSLAGAPVISGPKDAAEVARAVLPTDREGFAVIHLDTRLRVRSVEVISIGTLNATLVHPREVFKGAILANAAGIILSHNHPSGNPDPSREDIGMTKRLVAAGKLMGIDVLDHVIVAGPSFYSFKSRGAL